MSESNAPRRGMLRRLAGLAGLTAAAQPAVRAQGQAQADHRYLPPYARAMNHQSLKQSSYDRTGGNSDRWPIKPGDTIDIFNSAGPGVITHIWFTIAAASLNHLKEVVIRMYWDGNAKPSVEVPVGDFFGLNLGQYILYQSAYLNCSPVKALNAYFAMPFRRLARITATNEGTQDVNSFYSNIDYQLVPALPDDAMYFHAQYRQAAPTEATTNDWKTNGDANRLKNPDGKQNYVFAEARGRGHLLGVTLGVLQNQEFWMGEGDEMIFIDDETKPAIVGTGSEDYFNGAWDFGGREVSVPFGYLYNGSHMITNAERTGGRYCLYRWHSDNPVTFNRYLKMTMEHGHANHRADNWYSVCYWYQSQPYTDFPTLPAAGARIPVMRSVAGPGGATP